MTLVQKIALLQEKDGTTIATNEHGYIVSTVDEDIELETKEELEDWIDYQLAADPVFYGLNVGDFIIASSHPLGIRLLDGVSGEPITIYNRDDYTYIGSRSIEAIEQSGNETKVYISF